MPAVLVRRFGALAVAALLVAGLLPAAASPVRAVSPNVVISQVYGGGGNTGATYTNDFVELFNRGSSPVSLAGWSVQYASATGTGLFSANVTALSGTIQPGQYALVQLAAGSGGTTPLPTPDVTGAIALSAAAGKVIVANVSTGLACNGGSTACSSEQLAQIVDLVGYGSADFFEGSGAAPTLSNTTAALRASGGCTDTDSNAADFTAAAPGPRNTASPLNVCNQVPPVINEFSASTTGTDVEYVEIYGTPSSNYAAYTVLEIEGDTTGAGVVDEVIALGTTDASGFYLASLPASAIENGTISLLLVRGFSGTLSDDLDTNNDGTFDVTPWDTIVDSVAVNDGGLGDVTYGTPTLGVSYDGAAFAPGGASRIPDGADTDTAADWVRNDFDLAGIPGLTGTPALGEAYNTPGAPNALVLPALVINEVDYDQPGTDAAEFVEIRNGGAAAVSLDGVTIELVNGTGGGAAVYDTIALPAVDLAAGDYFVVCANATTVANCDLDDAPDTNFIQNGAPDAVGLRWEGTLIDAVSYEGDTGTPYTEGSGVGLVDDGVGATQGISRCPDGNDTDQNNVDFALASITPGAANLCVDAAPEVASTVPANGATDFPIAGNLAVTFSEPVNVTGSWFTLSCTVSGAVSATVSGGPTTFTLDPASDLVDGESCTLTIIAAGVTDQDANDPPDAMAADVIVGFTPFDVCIAPSTPIYSIQGSGPAAAITGVVTTQGVVVGDYEGPSPTLRGFYLQDATGDGDPATSDGIFVFNGNNDNVSLGDVVRVTGTASEFQDQTQVSATSVAACGTGTVTPVDVTLPVPSPTHLERFEGMLVRMPQTLYVTEHFQLGRFGQVVLSSGGRLAQPTNVVLPGAPALALQAANDLNRIILDDALNGQNPDPIVFGRGGSPLSASNTLRGGDTATGIVGVMTYTWAGNAASGNAYRVRPINALSGGVPDFQPANPRPTQAPDVGGSLRVAALNVLNYFVTLDYSSGNPLDNTCGPLNTVECRGADSAVELERQKAKLLEALLALDADVIGLVELENSAGVDALTDTANGIVPGLNAVAGPGTYAAIETGVIGTDTIRQALIYRPAAVTPVGPFEVIDAADDPRFVDTANRPALVQTFQEVATGAEFTVAVNHLKSKGSDCNALGDPDLGDGQGNCNVTRRLAAEAIADVLDAMVAAGTADPDILVLGDLNSYAQEDPITALEAAGYTNLIESFLGPDAYSYVFDGQWGYLDHALGSASIVSQVTGVADYHINADEPSVLDYNVEFKSVGQVASLFAPDEFRVSDHDPVIVGLDLVIPTTTELAIEPSTQQYSDTVTLTATISPSDATGSVEFKKSVNGGPWTTVPGGASVSVSGGEATLAGVVIPDAAGTDVRFKAKFTGTGVYTNSKDIKSLTVEHERRRDPLRRRQLRRRAGRRARRRVVGRPARALDRREGDDAGPRRDGLATRWRHRQGRARGEARAARPGRQHHARVCRRRCDRVRLRRRQAVHLHLAGRDLARHVRGRRQRDR